MVGPSYGGYSYESVKELEGRYVCLRPGFTSADVISAYIMDLRWEDAASCLTFEEKDRERMRATPNADESTSPTDGHS